MATEYGIRLKRARKNAKLTQVQLSKITGIPQSTISTAETVGQGSADTTVYAAACGVDPHWLATGEGEMTLATAQHDTFTPNVTPLVARARVPLISWIQAGGPSEVFDLFHPGEAIRWEDAIVSKPSRSAYALLVEGDSMVSSNGGHSFPAGTVLIVDPERGASANSYVIAKDVVSQKATFKQLVTDGARWYLKALNPQYPAIEIDDPCMRVIGVVIEAKPPAIQLV